MHFNKNEAIQTDNYDSVDGQYDKFYELCGRKVDEFVETTPFSRSEIYDFYTKFKALSKLCVENMRTRRVKREQYTRKKRLVDHIGELAKTNPTTRDPEEFDDKRAFTPKLQHTDKVTSYKNKVAIKNYQVENVGVHLHEFKQGLRVCRI